MGSFVAADASALTTSVTTLTGVTWMGHNAHDIAIVGWASDNTQTRTEPPTGFTAEFTNADGSLRAIVSSLDTTGSESGDVSLVCGGANRQAGVLALYRGYNPSITNITSLAELSGTAVTTHSSPSITPADSASAVVLIYMDRVTTSVIPTAPAGYSVRGSFATSGSGGVTVVVADKLSGLTAGVPESPAAWTGGAASTAAYVIALELTPLITGTAAVTQAGQTSSASGVLGYTGTVAQTQTGQTPSASGTFTSSGVSGTVAVTQSAQTSTASGALGYTGTAAPTQTAQTSAASGVLGYTGSLARTQANQTPTASGAFTPAGISGTLARTQANQTAGATGSLGYTGTLALTQTAQIASASGTVLDPVIGTAAVTQGAQTASAVGVLGYVATASLTQVDDTAAAVGIFFIPTVGTIAATQGAQTADASGVSFDRIITRPDQGTTSRPAVGVAPRPFAGTTPRP